MSRILLPVKRVSEALNVVFDFASLLAIGENISSQTVTSTVYSGTDASPSSMISGAATSVGSQVTQKIQGGVAGVAYDLQCKIVTSNAQTIELHGLLVVEADALQ